MVPPPPPDFEAAHVFAQPPHVPPKGTPLAIPASLQAAVSSKTVPLAGQNKFSKVEVIDGTFMEKILIAPPNLFQFISDHRYTPVDVLGAPYLFATQVVQRSETTPTFVPGISYSIADYGMANFAWSSLVGKTTLLLVPDFAPWQDEAPFLFPKTLVQACVKVLEEGKTQGSVTNIYFGSLRRPRHRTPVWLPSLT